MGSRLVAEYDPATSQYHYYTQDQIGSTRIVTDDAGAVVYAAAHDPYGGIQQTWTNAFDPKRKFSDKERDEETGLDYFGARYFANASYRWLSIDPVLITERAIAHSQAWNLYAYCGNNPVTFSDPDGRVLFAISAAAVMISHSASLIHQRLAVIELLKLTFPVWQDTPYADKNSPFAGPNAKAGKGADCGGATHGHLKDSNFDFIYKTANKEDPDNNFTQSACEGGDNEKFLRLIGPGESPIFGDIAYWDGKHEAIYAGKKDGNDMIYTTSSAGYKEMQIEYMNKNLGSSPPYYRLLFK